MQFFRIFLPRGIPQWLVPLLVVIEILSFLIRPMSLAIRLFANMLAGHILLFIIATASLVLAKSVFLLGFLPFSFILIFLVLEIGIAFLQAYVFTVLSSIYINEALQLH
jgi:F-type H+-transporting ATPase subunit a